MSGTGTKRILVTGGTGRQGGAAVRSLTSLGHSVRIMTRQPEKTRGLKGVNVEVVQGDFRKRESLLSALEGMDGVFLMGTPFEEGPEAETAQGKAAIDACVKQDIGHVLYSSVCCANKRTGVPHFDSKYAVEEHLKEAGLSYTILRPVWFMENFASEEWYRPSIEKGILSTPLSPDRPLQMVSVDDIGRMVAEVFTKPLKFVGREIELAADQLTMGQIVEEMSRVLQHPVRYEQIPDSGAEKAVGRDLALMFRWFNEHGYDVDLWTSRERFRRLQISPTSFRAYLEKSHLGIGQAA
jgi:uncharacterized protein YbjT (DUF2867 family)